MILDRKDEKKNLVQDVVVDGSLIRRWTLGKWGQRM
jgi:hypothetical protein